MPDFAVYRYANKLFKYFKCIFLYSGILSIVV